MIHFRCECGRQLQARGQDIGRLAACPLCGKTTFVPSEDKQRLDTIPARESLAQANQSGSITGAGSTSDKSAPASIEDGQGRSKSSNWLATTSLVCGLLSVPFSFMMLLSLLAIILGILALWKARGPGQARGKKKAIAGLVFACLGLVVFSVLLFTGERERRLRAEDASNLKQIVLALCDHNDAYGFCPRATAYNTRDGKPGLSWRVALLPFIREKALFKKFKLDEPWDSPHNVQLLDQMPQIYQLPGKSDNGLTHYQVFIGLDTPFTVEEPMPPAIRQPHIPIAGPRNPRHFPQGTSNTVMVATARKPVPWTKPEDLPFTYGKPLPPLGGHFPGVFHIALADGTVLLIADKDAGKMLPRRITCNDPDPPFHPQW